MRTVLLIGAGGSLAQAQSYRAKQTREHPPLDTTFFAKGQELAQHDSDVALSLQRLEGAIRTQGGQAPWVTGGGSLEQYFADVYYEVATQRSQEAFEVFKALLGFYLQVLAVTTNWMAVRSDEAILGKIIRQEIDRAAGDVPTVITFNQDLVLENIVSRLPRWGDRWCMTRLYGGADLEVLHRGGQETFPAHGGQCPHTTPLVLLKLHGSLNWGLRTSTREPHLGTLFPQNRNKLVYLKDARIASGDVERVRTLTPQGRTTWYLWPLVVPPIYDKQRITGMRVLQGLWDRAEQAIAEAERLVIVGYSLPNADVLARQSLRRGYLANQELVAVDCVNPEVGVAAKLKESLNCRVVRLFHDADDYLRYAG